MNRRVATLMVLACTVCFVSLGCEAPGKPVQAEVNRPDEVLDFSTLYKQNCAGCHGKDGRGGATLPLANPVYLGVAGFDNIQRITADGVAGTAMPPFARSRGGMLSDRQISALSKSIINSWGNADTGQLIPYASKAVGDPASGQAAYATFCARCHSANGTGMKSESGAWTGSIVDPAYLALVSDQYLRSIIIGGLPDRNMPDWRSDLTGPNARAMTDQEIADTVAWIVSHRVATPGQPYAQHP
jgi:cytochrome c oxidase cbb3-type subunit 3/ubiquinol-cytochrome c reductase cytochrome c subunit